MAQEQPRTIGEALEQPRAARMDNHDRVVMDQIADAVISIQFARDVPSWKAKIHRYAGR